MMRPTIKHMVEVTGFLGTCIALFSWFTAPQERPEAEVYYAEFELPPSLMQQLHALAPLTDVEDARSHFKSSVRRGILPGTGGTVDQVLGIVMEFVGENAPAVRFPGDFLFKGYWKVTIRNPGSRTASAVTVHFPTKVSGVISRPHTEQAEVQDLPVSTTDAFAVGNVQPADQVIVYGWTLSPATEAEAKKITLTHDMGSGRVVITH